MAEQEITRGSRILVFDHRLYEDDVSTPLSVTMKPATVYRRRIVTMHDRVCKKDLRQDVVDVLFDHRPSELSRGHFTHLVELIAETPAKTPQAHTE